MNTPQCPRCGTPIHEPLAEGAPCPGCVLRSALEHGTPAAIPGRPTLDEVQTALTEFEIEGCLGRGGMGDVYRAQHKRLGRSVAVKVLRPDLELAPEFAERFEREARAMARLQHPNIVTIHDFGESEGLFYLVMEDVEGASLRELMDADLSPRDVADFADQALEALAFAHGRGVIHRDIKPENLLVDVDGRLRLVDFGLAKLESEGGAGLSLTGAQGRLGTPHYMAPEQVAASSTVDHRADLYALGVVIYEALTGTLPLGRFRLPSESDAALGSFDGPIFRLLENDPERRYPTAEVARKDWNAAVQTTPTMDPSPEVTARGGTDSPPEVEINGDAVDPRPRAHTGAPKLLEKALKATTEDEHIEACLELGRTHGDRDDVREALLVHALHSDLCTHLLPVIREAWTEDQRVEWVRRLLTEPIADGMGNFYGNQGLYTHLAEDPPLQAFLGSLISAVAPVGHADSRRALQLKENLASWVFQFVPQDADVDRDRWVSDVVFSARSFEDAPRIDAPLLIDAPSSSNLLPLLVPSATFAEGARRLVRDEVLYGLGGRASIGVFPRESSSSCTPFVRAWGSSLAGRETLRALAGSKKPGVAARANCALLALDPRDPEPARALLRGLSDPDGTDPFTWHTYASEPFREHADTWCRVSATRPMMLELAAPHQERWVAEMALLPLAKHAASTGQDNEVLALVEAWSSKPEKDGGRLGQRAAAILRGDVEEAQPSPLVKIREGRSIRECLGACGADSDATERVQAIDGIRDRVSLGFEELPEGASETILDLARQGSSAEVRRAALACMALLPMERQRAGSTAVQHLEGDSDAGVRSNAVEVLAWLGQPNDLSREALLRASRRDEDPGIRRGALVALGALAEEDRDVRSALASRAKEDEEPSCRAAALHFLARASRDGALTLDTILERLAEDPSPMVRIMAVRELAHGQPGDPKLAQVLRKQFEQESTEEVRSAICRFLPLGWPEDPLTLRSLQGVLLEEEDSAVCEAAIQSLVWSRGDNPELVAWLQGMLDDTDREARHAVLLEALVRVAPDHPELEAQFARRIQGPSAQSWIALRAELLTYLPDAESWLWDQVVGASQRGKAPSPSALAALIGRYSYDADVLLELQALVAPDPASPQDSGDGDESGFLEGTPRAWVHALEAILEAWGHEVGVVDALIPFRAYLNGVATEVSLGKRLRNDAKALAEKIEARVAAEEGQGSDEGLPRSTSALIREAESGVGSPAGSDTSTPGTATAGARIAAVAELRRRRRADDPPIEDILATFLAVAEVDADPEVRVAAIEALADSLNDPGTLDVLGSIAVEDADSRPRGAALRILGRKRGEVAIQRLLRERAVEDGDDGVRLRALEALSAPKPSQEESAVERDLLRDRVQHDPSFDLRTKILRSSQLGPRLGQDWLKALATRDTSALDEHRAWDALRRAAFDTLCRDRGALDFDWVAERVTTGEDVELRANASRRLLETWSRDPRSLATVLRVAEDDPSVKVRKAIHWELRASERFREHPDVVALLEPTPERKQLARVRRAVLAAEPGQENQAIGMLWATKQMEPRRREQRELCGFLGQERDPHVRRKLIEFFLAQRVLITEWSEDHEAMVLDREENDDDAGIRELLAPVAREIHEARSAKATPDPRDAPPARPRPRDSAAKSKRDSSARAPRARGSKGSTPSGSEARSASRSESSTGSDSVPPRSSGSAFSGSGFSSSPGAETNRRVRETSERPTSPRPRGSGVSISRRPAWTSYWFDWTLILVLVLASSVLQTAAESAFPSLAKVPTLPPIGASLLFLQIVVRRHWYHYEIIGHGDPVARISIGIPTREQRSVQLQRAQIDVTRSLGGFLLGYGTLRIWVGEQESAAVWEDVARPFALRDQIERLRS